jgi:hypothetical protein
LKLEVALTKRPSRWHTTGRRIDIPAYRSLLWPLGQLVGPPCSCVDPGFNAHVTDITVFKARVLEWAGKGRHFVDGSAIGTGIFTCIAASHTRRWGLRGHNGRIAPFGPSRKSFCSLFYQETHYPKRPAAGSLRSDPEIFRAVNVEQKKAPSKFAGPS